MAGIERGNAPGGSGKSTHLKTAAPSFFLILIFFPLLSFSDDGSFQGGGPVDLPSGLPAGVPVENLSPKERELLERGEQLIRLIDSHKQARLSPDAPHADTILGPLKKLDPNLMAEAMYVLPVGAGNEKAMLEQAKQLLSNVENFHDIPYYSKHNDTVTPLFSDIRLETPPQMYGTSYNHFEIKAVMRMNPFDRYTSVFSYSLNKDTLLYSTCNTTPLYYKVFKGVGAKEMRTYLLVTAHEGSLFIYGLGGVEAFTFFGLFKDRLHTAFAGRVQAVFEWFCKEMS